MEQFFTSLSKRQTMLLLTGVTFGGHDCVQSFDFLAGYESDLLKYRAQELMQIPREKRIPILVQEIKRIVTSRPAELHSADPEILAEVLGGERLAAREILLRAFPEALADAVREYLPPPPQGWRPPKRLRPEVLSILRGRLEDALRATGTGAQFKFSDVLLLQTRELLTLCDHLGARVLGPSIAGLADADREKFLGALPPDLLAMCNRAVEASKSRKLSDRDAEEILELHGYLRSQGDSVRSAGSQKLMRACLAQSAEFAARLVERQRGEFGALLVKWIREERAKAVARGDGGRTEIVEELEQLERAGLVSKPARMPSPMPKGARPSRPMPSLPAARAASSALPSPRALAKIGVPAAPDDGLMRSSPRRSSERPVAAEAKPPSGRRSGAHKSSERLPVAADAKPPTGRRSGEHKSSERLPVAASPKPPSGRRSGAHKSSDRLGNAPRPPSERVPIGAAPKVPSGKTPLVTDPRPPSERALGAAPKSPSSRHAAVTDESSKPAERPPIATMPKPPSGRAPLTDPPRPSSARMQAAGTPEAPQRPPSDRVPLAAQARGASASAKFRAAAEAAAPKPLGDGDRPRSSSLEQWNMPRPAVSQAQSDPAITIPPHRVKKSPPKPERTDEVTDPGSGGGPRPKRGSDPEKD